MSQFARLLSIIPDMGSRELFKNCHGPKTIVGILDVSENLETLAAGFSIVAMAATANEILKESFMELKIDELIIRVLTRPGKHCIQSVYDAICVLLAADDNRVVASQVSGEVLNFLILHD